MDAGTKLLLLVGLLVLPLSTWARDIEPLTDEKKETLTFALAQANAAVAVLDARIGECVVSQGKVFDPALFKGFSLTDQEWADALAILYSRAAARCVNKDGVHHRALVALMQFRKTEKSYTGKNDTKTVHSPEDICCNNWIFGSRDEMQYSKLDPGIRQRLEAIPGIDELFDLVKTFLAARAINQPPVDKK